MLLESHCSSILGEGTMKRSTERILVTHVGSLARPHDLMEMLIARNEGKTYDREALSTHTRNAVAEVVKK